MAYSQLADIRWTNNNPNIQAVFEYDYRRTGSSMEYNVRITIKALSNTDPSGYFGYDIKTDILLDNVKKISGYTIKSASKSTWSSAIVYNSGWLNVTNKTSGTTGLKIRLYSSGSSRDVTYGTYNLTVIPYISTLTASNGTLGTAQTLTIHANNASYTHKITYTCGNASGDVGTYQAGTTSVSWTPPTSLSSQNPSGTSVSITLTLITYSSGTELGRNNTTITCSFTAGAPTVSVTLSDPTGHKTTYNGYVQNKSKLKVDVTATPKSGATIKSYGINVYYDFIDAQLPVGSSASQTLTTDLLQYNGTNNIVATATDSRGVTGTYSGTITVLEYSNPSVSVVGYRCDSSGNKKSDGNYIKVEFTGKVSSLNNNNHATYVVRYRQVGASSWTYTHTMTGISNIYNASGSYRFTQQLSADKAYEVSATVQDDFSTTESIIQTVGVSFMLMQFYHDGTGMAIGQQATKSNTLQVGIPIEGYIDRQPLASGTDLNNVTTPGKYRSVTTAGNYSNVPSNITSGTEFLLDVSNARGNNSGDIFQELTAFYGGTMYSKWDRPYLNGTGWSRWGQVAAEITENTWKPRLCYSNSDGTIATSVTSTTDGNYYTIGKLVFVSFFVSSPSVPSYYSSSYDYATVELPLAPSQRAIIPITFAGTIADYLGNAIAAGSAAPIFLEVRENKVLATIRYGSGSTRARWRSGGSDFGFSGVYLTN